MLQAIGYRGLAQFGSAHGLGPWGRGFESLNPDHIKRQSIMLWRLQKRYAPVAELADALDLGSSVPDVKVQVLSGAPS